MVESSTRTLIHTTHTSPPPLPDKAVVFLVFICLLENLCDEKEQQRFVFFGTLRHHYALFLSKSSPSSDDGRWKVPITTRTHAHTLHLDAHVHIHTYTCYTSLSSSSGRIAHTINNSFTTAPTATTISILYFTYNTRKQQRHHHHM